MGGLTVCGNFVSGVNIFEENFCGNFYLRIVEKNAKPSKLLLAAKSIKDASAVG